MKKNLTFIILSVLIIGSLFYLGKLNDEKELVDLSESDSTLAANTCVVHQDLGMHIHPVIKINILGAYQDIPKNIGIDSTCMKAIHTHDEPGVIHIEYPVVKDFYLKDFFSVWGVDFNKDQILDYKVDDNTEIIITVNGVEVDTFENTLLKDKDIIEIIFRNKEM
ncbi:hypothetical protein H6790_01580 [Candidatus Nomurabacteria bacterium]|nr:hypothetical protein [Candidatus Nomurabacteria bacterium]